VLAVEVDLYSTGNSGASTGLVPRELIDLSDFGSSLSLPTMLERRPVDLKGHFDIVLVNWDSIMSFPRDSVCTFPGVNDYIQVLMNK
jgi:hypothetical protein